MVIDFVKEYIISNNNLYTFKSYPVYNFNQDDICQLCLDKINREEEIELIAYRFRNAEEIFIFLQLCDIIKRQSLIVKTLRIYYFCFTEQCSLKSLDYSFALKIICDSINELQAQNVEIVDPYSSKVCNYIKNSHVVNSGLQHLISKMDDRNFCFADVRNYNKYRDSSVFYYHYNNHFLWAGCDPNSGQVKLFNSPYFSLVGAPVTIILDYSNGGAPLSKIIPLLQEDYKKGIEVVISHLDDVTLVRQLAEVCTTVYVSNSYSNWEKSIKLNNVIVFDCITGSSL